MSKASTGNFFEDFRVGQEFRHATPRTLTEADSALNVGLYGSRFALNSSDVFARTLGLPRAPQWAEPVWHLYVVRTERRAEVMAALDKAGIGSLIHYPIPPHLQAAYADLGLGKGSFPLAEQLAETVLSLPMGAHMPETAVDEVAAVVQATLR